MSSSHSERSVLHLVVGAGTDALHDALALCRAHDALLLAQDAALAALASRAASAALAAAPCARYVLQPDLVARGFGDAPLHAGVERIDHARMVELAVAHATSMTWG